MGEFEAKMKNYHRMQLSQSDSSGAGLPGLRGKIGMGLAKSSLQSIGLQLGKQTINAPVTKPVTKSVKSLKTKSVSRRTSVVSTETSQAY